MTGKEKIEINVQMRNTGKHSSRGLRVAKQVPAVIYGPNVKNMNISMSEIEAVKYSAHQFDNAIFTLKSENKEINNIQVLKKDMTVHPVKRRPTHIDFYALDMAASVRVHVELKYIGKPVGLKEGGLLQEIRRDVEIECLANDIPQGFEINIEALEIGDVLHVSDIPTSDNIKMITTAGEAIVSVTQPKEDEPEPAAAAVGDVAPAGDAKAAEAKAGDDKK